MKIRFWVNTIRVNNELWELWEWCLLNVDKIAPNQFLKATNGNIRTTAATDGSYSDPPPSKRPLPPQAQSAAATHYLPLEAPVTEATLVLCYQTRPVKGEISFRGLLMLNHTASSTHSPLSYFPSQHPTTYKAPLTSRPHSPRPCYLQWERGKRWGED